MQGQQPFSLSILFAGLPQSQPEQPLPAQDTAAPLKDVTGALATPRDSAAEQVASKSPSVFGPLNRCGSNTISQLSHIRMI